jgi:hypothetical protein
MEKTDPKTDQKNGQNLSQKNSPNSNQQAGRNTQAPEMQASFSTLILSIGSSAAMSLGLAPNPDAKAGEPIETAEKDLPLARFNIDLLRMLRDKTKNNLANDEQRFLDSIINDLQLKFVQANAK